MLGGLKKRFGYSYKVCLLRRRAFSCYASNPAMGFLQPLTLSNEDLREKQDGCCSQEQLEQSLEKLRHLGDCAEDSVAYASLLRQCGNANAPEQGRRIHQHILQARRGRLNRYLSNFLVEMYGKCGCVKDARAVFDAIRQPNVFSWTLMVAAYTQNGHNKEALELFQSMEKLGAKPDRIALVGVLEACTNMADPEQGKEVHGSVVRNGLESDVLVGTALVKMYAKCRSVQDAERVFARMEKDLVAWNAMISACAQNGHSVGALKLFREMELEGMKPDRVSLISLADACTELAQGKAIYRRILENGLESDTVVGNILVNMFGKCGSLQNARNIFCMMQCKNVITWTAMIAAYAQNGHPKEALQLFREMDAEGEMPNEVTFVSALDACACLASAAQGKLIHDCILESGSKPDVMVNSALVSMYGKCGNLVESRSLFDKIHQRNTITWTSMIAAYAHSGLGKEALQLFREMELQGMKPDCVTFVSVLYGCSHSGLLAQGWECFVSMVSDHGIAPMAEHFKCMIDLLARAGWLNLAEDLINSMPIQPDAVAWMTLLGACVIHRDVKRGERFAKRVFELDPKIPGQYVMLSRVYAAAGRWTEAAKIRKAMNAKHLRKEPGYSWIVVKNKLHEFYADDTTHPLTERIFAELQRLNQQMKMAGYVPDTKALLQNLEEEEKEQMLCYHSEKLAIGYGLIATPCGTPLHIGKNLRVCFDCHTAIKFICKIVGRAVIVRDTSRFHRFEDGVCSCGDYW